MEGELPQFKEFPKIARLSRQCVITEKLDGTNAQIYITPEGMMFFGSRTRWITTQDDNFGFAKRATEHRDELSQLGPGRHFGEWWGSGIQRGYGLPKGEKRFSLFNVIRWCLPGEMPLETPTEDPRVVKVQKVLPACCGLVPVLYRGDFTTHNCEAALKRLRADGSHAAPGFMKPEGIVCFHTASNSGFKKTLEKDEAPKSLANKVVAA
ncbi:MAG: RNA ligase family protein [Pirellulales bacterium]